MKKLAFTFLITLLLVGCGKQEPTEIIETVGENNTVSENTIEVEEEIIEEDLIIAADMDKSQIDHSKEYEDFTNTAQDLYDWIKEGLGNVYFVEDSGDGYNYFASDMEYGEISFTPQRNEDIKALIKSLRENQYDGYTVEYLGENAYFLKNTDLIKHIVLIRGNIFIDLDLESDLDKPKAESVLQEVLRRFSVFSGAVNYNEMYDYKPEEQQDYTFDTFFLDVETIYPDAFIENNNNNVVLVDMTEDNGFFLRCIPSNEDVLDSVRESYLINKYEKDIVETEIDTWEIYENGVLQNYVMIRGNVQFIIDLYGEPVHRIECVNEILSTFGSFDKIVEV